ncbi:type II secretion system protein GspL [Geomonas sp. RF6]|uniref:type II secretion system protein GspL n=1 Tax=Geomonas sp. RF6 TaxID=2897342 RepID=UPI001E336AC2|nr:type II secretion system protein GspL [Geomonas sp. RF6]UFS71601.1 type II secretion system protein GspL [Geomonas sp. RF6]
MDLFVVELKRDEVILATFRRNRGAVTFVEAQRHPNGEDDLAAVLRSVPPGTERRVILALPPTELFMRELELPLTDRGKVRELLPLELKGETALDTDELVFDALPLEPGKFLAVWGRAKDLAEKVALLKDAGLEPEIITASLFHWDTLAPAAGTVAVADGEALAAFSDRTPIFFRALPPHAGDEEVQRTVAALEIGKGVEVERVVRISHAFGGESAEVSAELAGAFGDDAHAARDLAGAYAVAAAVAAGKAVDLRRGPLSYTAGTEKLRRRLRIPLVLLGVLIVLAFVESGVRYRLVYKDVVSLDSSIKGIYRAVFPTRKKPVDEVAELRSEIRRLEGAKTSSNVLTVLNQLAEAKGDDVTGLYEIEVDGNEVRAKGDARSFQGTADFKSRAAKFFDGGEVTDNKSRPDGSVTFAYHGTWKGVAR